METNQIIGIVLGISALLMLGIAVFKRNDTTKESWVTTALFFPFRTLKDALLALTMSAEGWSLKKSLACVAVYVGAHISFLYGDKSLLLPLVWTWLAFAGILIGVYSFGDIMGALGKFKASAPPATTPQQ